MTEEEALRTLRGDDVAAATRAANALWQMWHRSGDDRLDGMLRDGIEAMEWQDLDAADAAFTRLIETAPAFAEGWNKRATAYYLMGDFDHSLKDCAEVIKRNPQHFGALSGYGMIYVRLGRLETALGYFERALEINPNLKGVEDSINLIREKLRQDGKQDI